MKGALLQCKSRKKKVGLMNQYCRCSFSYVCELAFQIFGFLYFGGLFIICILPVCVFLLVIFGRLCFTICNVWLAKKSSRFDTNQFPDTSTSRNQLPMRIRTMLHNDQTVILLLADATNFPIYSDLISHFEMKKSFSQRTRLRWIR